MFKPASITRHANTTEITDKDGITSNVFLLDILSRQPSGELRELASARFIDWDAFCDTVERNVQRIEQEQRVLYKDDTALYGERTGFRLGFAYEPDLEASTAAARLEAVNRRRAMFERVQLLRESA